MTEKLYDKDSFTKEFDAVVLSSEEAADGYAVILDRTAFFPEGGGQPSDTGFINDAAVFDVQIENEIITHFTDKPFEAGQRIRGVLNFERRFDFMQQHSGEHIVSGTAHRLYACENVGFHLSEDIVTLDLDKPLTRAQAEKIEALSNEAVFANKAFYTYYPDGEKLKTLDYRSKKAIDGDIRIVEIEDTDICACCAPHVKTAGQIGIIKLLSLEKLRGGVRMEIKCGRRALCDYNERYINTALIGEKLAVKYNETAVAVERLLGNINELKFTVTSLKKRLNDQKVKSFAPQSDISAEFEEGLEIKDMQAYADALYKKAGGIRAVLCERSADEYAFVICGEDAAVREFFANFKERFTVRGGGRNGMVQGSVFGDKNALTHFFTK